MIWIWVHSEKLSQVAGVLAVVITLVAVLVAWLQFRAQQHIQREATAKETFRNYLLLGVEYPRFASPHLAKIDYRRETFDGSAERYQQYTWFVSVLLLGCEQILLVRPTADWRSSLRVQLTYHRRYLEKDFPALREEYTRGLRELVDDVLREKPQTSAGGGAAHTLAALLSYALTRA